ncbi:hypothetical protein HID58_065808, partial [Brassica napus]
RNRDEAESERTYDVVKNLRKPLLCEVGDAGGVTPLRRNQPPTPVAPKTITREDDEDEKLIAFRGEPLEQINGMVSRLIGKAPNFPNYKTRKRNNGQRAKVELFFLGSRTKWLMLMLVMLFDLVAKLNSKYKHKLRKDKRRAFTWTYLKW